MPLLAVFLPSVRTQRPDIVRDSSRDRKQPRVLRTSPEPVLIAPQRVGTSPSLSSTETLHNDNDEHNIVLSTVNEAAVSTTTARHICNPRTCFKRASTSASAHSSVEHLPPNVRRSSSLDRGLFTLQRCGQNALPGSPQQLSPRSSVEADRDLALRRPLTATSAADAKPRKAPRRSLGLFNRKKGSKAVTVEHGPLPSDVESLPATPPTMITSLPLTHEPLDSIPSDSEEGVKHPRRRSWGGGMRSCSS